MPLLAPILGEAKLLSLGLFAACINVSACTYTNAINELFNCVTLRQIADALLDMIECRCLFAAYLGQLG